MAIDFKEADLLQPFRWVSELFTGDTDLGPADLFGEYVRDIDLGIPDETLVTVAKLIAFSTGQGWAIPFIEGGATLAQGGSIEDALKNAAVSYVAGEVSGAVADSAGSYITDFVGDELAETFAGTLLTDVTPDAISSATLAAFKGQDPWEAFLSAALTSSVGNSVNAAMSKIDDATNQAFTTKLPPAAQNLIKASLESTLIGGVTGENITEAALARAITQSTTVTNTLSNFFGDNTNLDSGQVSALTLAVQRSAAAAFTGGDIGDALQLTLNQYGQQEFNIVTDKIVRNSIDKLQGTYQEYARVSSEISAAGVKRDTALGEFRTLENRVIDAQFVRDEAAKAMEDVQTRWLNEGLTKTEAETLAQTTSDAFTEAQALWETAYAEVESSGVLDDVGKQFKKFNDLVDSLSEELAGIGETLYSDTSQLDPGMQTLYSAVDKSFTLAMDPSFNEAQYKEFNNLGDDVDGYFHWLNEGQKAGLPTNADEAYAQRNTAEVALQNAVLKNLNLTATDFSKDDLASLRTLVSQSLPDGSYDPSVVDLEAIKSIATNFLTNSNAWTEYTSNEEATAQHQALLNKSLVNKYLEGSESLNLGDAYTDDFNNLLSNLGLPTGVVGETKINQEDLDGIIASFKDIDNSFVPTDAITAAEGVTGQDIADGKATLTIKEDGLLEWDNLEFKARRFRPHWNPEYGTYGKFIEVEEGSDFATQEGGKQLVFVNLKGEQVGKPFLNLTIDSPTIVDGEGTSLEDLKTTNAKAFIINAASLDLSDNSIADSIKELAGTTLFNTVQNVKAYAEATDSGFDNWIVDVVGSTTIGIGGIVGFTNDAVNLMLGFDPNSSSFSAMAENIEAFGADVRSDEFNNTVEKAWQRVGEADGFLGTLSAFGGELADAPVEMLTSIIFEEMSQELLPALVTGGTATFAKAAFRQMGEATAKNMASKLALKAGATTDLMESFGGAGGSMYDEAYDYLIAQGATEDEAQRGAYERAMQSGLMSAVFTAASFGVGGLAFEKKIAGKVGDSKGSFAKSLDEWVKRVGDNAKIIGKEGVSESLEEGSATYVDELILYDLDPNRDVWGNVAIGMSVGALASSGTVGGVTALSNIISSINPTINSIVTTAAKTAEGAAQVGLLLGNLGLDPVITNNILNTVYDAGYTSNEEAATAFQEANPNYIPTTEELNNFAVKRNDSDLAAEVASYIGANYISASEIQDAALAEGITLTDEQAAELATKTDDKTTTLEEIIAEVSPVSMTDVTAAITAAIDGLPESATAQDIQDALAAVDGVTVNNDGTLSVDGVTEEDLTKDGGILDTALDGLISQAGLTELLKNYSTTDTITQDITAAITAAIDGLPETSTPEEIASAIQAAVDGISTGVSEADLTAALEKLDLGTDTDAVQAIINSNNFLEDTEVDRRIAAAVDALPETSTPEEIASAIQAAVDGISTGVSEADLTAALEKLDLGTDTDAVQAIINSNNFLEDTEVDRRIAAAVDALPVGATEAQVSKAIEDAISDLNNLSTEDVTTAVSNALADLDYLTPTQVQSVVEDAVSGIKVQTNAEAVQLANETQIALDKADTLAADANIAAKAAAEARINAASQAAIASADAAAATARATANSALAAAQALYSEVNVTALANSELITNLNSQINDLTSIQTASTIDAQTQDEALAIEEGAAAERATMLANLTGQLAAAETSRAEINKQRAAADAALAAAQQKAELARQADNNAAIARGQAITQGQIAAADTAAANARAAALAAEQEINTIRATQKQITAENNVILDEISSLQTQIDATSQTELDAITATSQAELDAIAAASETELEAIGIVDRDLELLATFVGKPAQDVTQADADFVIDLIAQENVSTENLAKYDYNNDGVIDENDQATIQAALDAGVVPSTGLYAAIDSQTEDLTGQIDTQTEDLTGQITDQTTNLTGQIDTQTDTLTDQAIDLNTQLNTQMALDEKERNYSDLLRMVGGSGDRKGQRVDVSTPDPGEINPYTFESIFRDLEQAGQYLSPYDTTLGRTPQGQGKTLAPSLTGRRGFYQGGQVEDENDMLLRIIGEM